ncbi:MAG TPA: VWA domain-containing protein [Pyrinomonadaceae bacterium]|nr:VWA domain-containing protein [Pyrinomonadaceae bacterium]
MNGRVFLAALLLCSLWLSVSGQQPQPAPRPSPSPTQQNPPRDEDQDVVRITTNLVQVDVVVTKDGKQVTDLKPEDFEIFEDGRPQKITNFSYISNVPAGASNPVPRPLPKAKNSDKSSPPVVPAAVHPYEVRRTIALVVDDLGMSFASMAQTRKQLRKFLDDQLQPNDLVAIIRTGGEVGSLQQFTTDRRLLNSALDHLKWNHCSRTGLDVFARVGPLEPSSTGAGTGPCGGHQINGTLSILRFVMQGMRDLPGRKSVVVFSDNLPVQQQEPGPLMLGDRRDNQTSSGSGTYNPFDNSLSYMAQLQKIAELAIRASVVVYGVDTRGLQYTGITAADSLNAASVRALMNQTNTIERNRARALWEGQQGTDLIARQTGGFLIRFSNDFALRRVMDDQRGYYLIGYRPSDQTFNRRFHHIKARVKGRGLTLRTREGFYGVTEDEARPRELVARGQMERALISPFGANDITVRLTSFFTNDAASGSLLRSFLYIDPNNLTFVDQPDGWHTATFDLSSILFGDNGKVVGRQDQTGTLRLKGQDYDRAMREGVVYRFDLPVKQTGTFQFRVAVRDQTTSRLGAAGQFIEVPNLRDNRLALSGIAIHGAGILHDRTNTVIPSPTPLSAFDQSNEPATAAADEMINGPGVRRFHQGSTLVFAYTIYNALVDQVTHQPQLTTQTRVFRDGKLIYEVNPTAVDVSRQRDLQRPTAAAELQLGPELPPGQYVLQIIVEDRRAKEKTRTATQWIDFEVVK